MILLFARCFEKIHIISTYTCRSCCCSNIPPPLFAASISAVWNTVFGQGLGAKLSESPMTENTIVGADWTCSSCSSDSL